MLHLRTLAVTVFFASVFIFADSSCRKARTTSSACSTSTLYGYQSYFISGGTMISYFDTNASVGTISYSTALLTGYAHMVNSISSTQAAYNTFDNSYYTFKTDMGGSSGTLLYKVNGGTVNTFTGPGNYLFGLVYSRVSNKLYAFTDTNLVSLSFSSSSYTETTLAAPLHKIYGEYSGGNTTVDQLTGDIYCITGDTSIQYVERYTAASGAFSVVASSTGSWYMLGPRFNINDHLLYAIRQNYPSETYDLVSIDPAHGVITRLGSMPFNVNVDFFSTSFDPCGNKYIVSTAAGNLDSSTVAQFSPSGTMTYHTVVSGLYQGLDVQY